MTDLDAACVTGEPASSFRGNSGAVFELREPRITLLGERGGFDVEHDLVPLGPGAADGGGIPGARPGPIPDPAPDLVPGPTPSPEPAREAEPVPEPGRERTLGEETDGVRAQLGGLGCFVAAFRFVAASLFGPLPLFTATSFVASPIPPANRASLAASIARIRAAPTSGSNRPRTTYIPSSSGKTEKHRLLCRIRSARCSSNRLNVFHPLTNRSRLAAEPARAKSRSSASLSGVATRVIARTLLNDSSPLAIASEMSGKSSSARAALTFSFAVPRVMPVRHASHSAHDPNPSFSQSRCRSDPARAARNSRVAAVISPNSTATRSMRSMRASDSSAS